MYKVGHRLDTERRVVYSTNMPGFSLHMQTCQGIVYSIKMHEYGLITIILLAISAFTAGFIDAVVGGGGLIQTPFLLITFPKMPLPILFGTNKIAALAGTSIAAFKYAKKIT